MKKDEFYEMHADFCKTFTNPKRIQILDLLHDQELTVTEIQQRIGESKAHTSFMLSIMRNKGVLKARRAGTNMYYSLTDDRIALACSAVRDALSKIVGKHRRAVVGK